jgi:transposase-like protein
MATVTAPKTLQQAAIYFANPENCLADMVKFRWPDGVVKCPTCGSEKVSYIKGRRVWECATKHSKRQFSAKVGTIMEDSALGLDKWLFAMWIICNAKNGVSSYELARSVGVTQKSAWFMLHRIRLAMQDKRGGKLSGDVEVDETYIGGKARNMHKGRRERIIKNGSKSKGKIAVMGLLERRIGGSQVRTQVLANTARRSVLEPIIRDNVQSGSNVYSDALPSYNRLNGQFIHEMIDHAEKYVEGQVHTNGLENFWSLVKRMLSGTYVSVEPFHLFRYLDEQAFRFNNRKLTDAARYAITAASIFGKRLTYNQLTAADATC